MYGAYYGGPQSLIVLYPRRFPRSPVMSTVSSALVECFFLLWDQKLRSLVLLFKTDDVQGALDARASTPIHNGFDCSEKHERLGAAEDVVYQESSLYCLCDGPTSAVAFLSAGGEPRAPNAFTL